MKVLKEHVLIVAPALPRWVSDFNVLSSTFAEAGWHVVVMHPRENGRSNSGWDSAETIDKARHALHPKVTSRPLPLSLNKGRISITDLIATSVKAAILVGQGSHLFILWSALPILLFGTWVRLFNRRCVYLVTGLGSLFSEARSRSMLSRTVAVTYRFLFSSPRSIVIVHNTEDKAELILRTGVSADRVFITGGCGVDPTAFTYRSTLRSETPTILVPSRLLKNKGILDAAAASGILSARGIRHHMLFTSNPVSGRIDALSPDELTKASRYPDVHFIGFQEDMAAVYAQADIVCVPSWYREGLQTALLEAAAAGCSIVACDNVGVREFLRPEIDGLVAPPRNPDALAKQLEILLVQCETAERLRANAHKRLCDGFTKDHMLGTTVKALERLGCRLSSEYGPDEDAT